MPRFLGGGPGLTFASIVAAIGELTSRKRKPSAAKIQADEKRRQKQRANAAQRMIDAHADCTAEIFDVSVRCFPERQYIRDLSIGDKVDIRRINGIYQLWSKDNKICNIDVPETSRLPYIFDHNVRKFAYLGGKMPNEYLFNFTNASIIVFYRLRGVPPTKVNLDTSDSI